MHVDAHPASCGLEDRIVLQPRATSSRAAHPARAGHRAGAGKGGLSATMEAGQAQVLLHMTEDKPPWCHRASYGGAHTSWRVQVLLPGK